MTFEEFFIKKKIDLEQLKTAEPALFEEFRYDFSQMGEKSFDHTKKFWFNKLRKIYHLKPVLKPEAHKPEKNPLARQAAPLSSPTIIEKPLYSPKFKPGLVSQPKPESSPEKEAKDSLASSEHPVSDESFSPKAPDKEVLSVPGPEVNAASPKPAYKPRFKAAAIKKEPEEFKAEKPSAIDENKEPRSPASEEPQAKPAYKPRFKPGMMNKPKSNDEAGDNDG